MEAIVNFKSQPFWRVPRHLTEYPLADRHLVDTVEINMSTKGYGHSIKYKFLQYWKYHLSFDDGEIFADIV
jgi:hypothetical protein